MFAIRPIVSVSVSFTLLVPLTGPARGQFKETYEPPGYILQWGSNGSSDGQFDWPGGVAIDTSGNIYVADIANHRIQKFDSAGVYLTKWGFGPSPADGYFNQPLGVAVDALGNVYVTDSGNHRVQKFDNVGNYLTKWGGNGTGDGQFVFPSGVAVDAAGNVYVADDQNHRIQKFDSVGNFLTQWGSNGSGDGQFDSPKGVTTDASGNVFVADGENNRIQMFDSVGNFLAKWGGFGTGDGQFDAPWGVTTDPSGNVYVTDGDNHRIQKFAPVLWFDVAGYDSYLSVATLHETAAVRTLFQLENNGAPRFAFKNTMSEIEWSFQQSGPGNFLISKEGTGGPEMQVYQTGMVRMGPGGANRFTLYPNGNLVIAGSLTANGSTFPDYVFEPDYDLMPLSDLRQHIAEKRRLPNLPSAEEVKQQGGHNMTELQLKLLEKIEELTLYTLKQEEKLQEVKALKQKNAQLEARLAAVEEILSDR